MAAPTTTVDAGDRFAHGPTFYACDGVVEKKQLQLTHVTPLFHGQDVRLLLYKLGKNLALGF